MKKALLLAYLVLFVLYLLFSYVLTDPNLLLLKSTTYWTAQQWLWREILPAATLRTLLFAALTLSLFLNYFLLLKNLRKKTISGSELKKLLLYFYLPLLLILLVSYNALSHDIFNYMFNAKMVWLYQADPHQQVALDFPDDPWLRFMNNTHTPAPYGYLWTALTVPVSMLGLNKFFPTWLLFKLFALLAFLLTLLLLRQFLKQEKDKHKLWSLVLLALNPLLLIEVVANGHNDYWMLLPALAALYLSKFKAHNLGNFFLTVLLLVLSIFTKFASLTLLPIFFYLWLRPSLNHLLTKSKSLAADLWQKLSFFLEQHFYLVASLLLFLPLVTARSQQFHPWYLSWPLLFLPLIKNRTYQRLLLVFSFSSLCRYLPWLYYLPWMTYDQAVPNFLLWQKYISWGLPLAFLLLSGLFFLFNRRRVK